MGNFVDSVEDRIQNANLTAIDCIITPKMELAIRLTIASSVRDTTSVTAISDLGEHIGNTAAPFENVSERNNTQHVFNTNDETQNNIPDELSEFSVPRTHFDRQPPTHHIKSLNFKTNCVSYDQKILFFLFFFSF